MTSPVATTANGWICSRCSTLQPQQAQFHYQFETAGAMDVFTKLVKISDVVLDNSSPGVMGRLGLDQASLEKIKKDIISVSLSGCGEIGPLKDTLVYAPLIIALGGLEGLLGYYGDTLPMNLAPGYGDTNAVCTALCRPRRPVAPRENRRRSARYPGGIICCYQSHRRSHHGLQYERPHPGIAG